MTKPTCLFFAVLCFIPAFLLHARAADIGPAELEYMAEDYPPANYVENGELKGASVELLHAIWEQMGVKPQPIRVYPWARGYERVKTRKNHVLFTMSRTPKREKLFQWVGPIFTARHVLVGLAESEIKIDSMADAKKYRIGTIRDDIGETLLLDAGIERENLQSVSKLELNMKKLVKKRVDLICQSQAAVREIIALKAYQPERFKTYFVINEMGNYYAFHRDTPPALIRRFQTALDQIRPQHERILKKYNMVY